MECDRFAAAMEFGVSWPTISTTLPAASLFTLSDRPDCSVDIARGLARPIVVIACMTWDGYATACSTTRISQTDDKFDGCHKSSLLSAAYSMS
jgi:hypothetical protein